LFDVLVKPPYRLEVFVRPVVISAFLCWSALALAGSTESPIVLRDGGAPGSATVSPTGARAAAESSKPASDSAKAAESDDEDADDDDDSEDAIESASDELSAAKAAEAKALSDEEQLRNQRIVAPSALGPGNPLLGEMNDLPDSLPQVEADAREASQIARELEQFETFDAREAASHYDIPVELNEQVSQYIRMFQGPLRSHFELWLSRSGRYIPSMRESLAREGVPEDTVFLSLIESGFNTLAYSVARAAGQWQFIASTGRRFGLRADFWVDERRDPEKATAAAAAYLKELRGQLGSWYLAWAGYNAGAGTIAKAIRRQHSADFWTLIRGRVLKRETKGYVPKLIAAALIAKHPHAFGFDDLKYQPMVPSETVEVAEPTTLAAIAEAAGTDLETLRDLNPALRRFCTPPPKDGKPYPVHVPIGTADRVEAALRTLPTSEHLVFRYHKVAPGEGLGAVSREFGVAPDAIARMNGLHRQALRPGRELVIPLSGSGAAGQTSDPKVAAVADEREVYKVRRGRRHRLRRVATFWRASDDCQDPVAKGSLAEGLVLEAEPEITPVTRKKRQPTLDLAAGEAVPPADASRYVVADGDTLWTIAQARGLSMDSLCAWNHIAHPKHAKIYPGQKLWVSGEVHGPASGPAIASPPATATWIAGNAATTYKLRDGDNLWEVAKRMRVKVADLMRWNQLDEDSVLQPGQVLRLGESAAQ
jgi:membrane-bound lytic murein transglycosylase D